MSENNSDLRESKNSLNEEKTGKERYLIKRARDFYKINPHPGFLWIPRNPVDELLITDSFEFNCQKYFSLLFDLISKVFCCKNS